MTLFKPTSAQLVIEGEEGTLGEGQHRLKLEHPRQEGTQLKFKRGKESKKALFLLSSNFHDNLTFISSWEMKQMTVTAMGSSK